MSSEQTPATVPPEAEDASSRQIKESGSQNRRLNIPAGVVSGLGDLVDFVLPVWAASVLGLSPTIIGLVLATDLLTAVCLRPVAGHLADRVDRRLLTSLGGAAFASGLALLSVTDSVAPLLASAVMMGIGSAFFWVPLRTSVSESPDPHRAFSELTSAEGTGIWVAYLIALSALPVVGYPGVFVLAAVGALTAAILVWRSSRSTPPPNLAGTPPRTRSTPGSAARFLAFVAAVAVVETAASVYLLLRLQDEFGLGLMDIVWLYVPGLVVYSMAPPWGIAATRRLGERGLLVGGLLLSVAGAMLVIFGPAPWILCTGWSLMCCSWAWLDPLQQTAASRVLSGGLGRAMGRYESATLAGGAAGAAAGGLALDITAPVGVAASALALLLASMPLALGVYSPKPSDDAMTRPQRPRRDLQMEWRKAQDHVVVYAVVQGLLWLAGLSWIGSMLTTGDPLRGLELTGGGFEAFLYLGAMAWGAVVALDVVVSGLAARRGGRSTLTGRTSTPTGTQKKGRS